jgi:hypothetical protein
MLRRLSSGATCAGATFLYTITVKPKPFIATNINVVSVAVQYLQ